MKIGIYGGSFNPPHLGHQMLANELASALCLDKLIIIPSNISPQKSNNGNIDPTHRINMCKILFDDEKYIVSDCEIKRGGKSYTFDTLNFIKSQYNDAELYLFMGSDMLLSFHSWYRYEDILAMCTLCAVSREDDNTRTEMLRYSENVLKKGNVQIFKVTPFQVSSSLIRENIRAGVSCDGLIDAGIAAYIKEHNLYERL